MDTEALEARSADLDEQIAHLVLSREVAAKQSILGLTTMQEAQPELLTRQDIRRETGWGVGSIGSPWTSRGDDYIEGDCKPHYQTAMDIEEIRGMGRLLSGSSELAECVLSNMRNYTIGQGSTVTVSPKGDTGEDVVKMVQDFVDEFLDFNDLTDEGEREYFNSAITDGDHLLWLRPQGIHVPKVRMVGGEHIAQPDNARSVEDFLGTVGLEWKYGVASEPGDPSAAVGYFLNWFGNAGENWDFALDAESVFIKRNVPRSCKRGISDFFIPFDSMERGGKLFSNAVLGATIQASIAGIRKMAGGATSSEISDALQDRLRSSATAYKPDGTSATVYKEHFKPGNVMTVANHDYMHGPMGTPQGPLFVDVVYQAVARLVGSRWCMPEYMISGDASNANYSSTLVAESPFIKEVQNEQATLSRILRRLLWKAMRMASASGRFQGLSDVELYRMVAIEVEYPSAESRDAMQVEQVFDLQQNAGVLSAKTRAAKSNLDYEQEVGNGAKPRELSSALPFGDDEAAPEAPIAPTAAVVPTPDADVEVAPVMPQPKPEEEGAKNTVDDLVLNGAQISAALEILGGVSTGLHAVAVARELLLSLGIDPKSVEKMLAATTPGAFSATEQEAVMGALESVSSTEEAKAILESLK